jgi:hypothetical protein
MWKLISYEEYGLGFLVSFISVLLYIWFNKDQLKLDLSTLFIIIIISYIWHLHNLQNYLLSLNLIIYLNLLIYFICLFTTVPNQHKLL